MSASFLFLLPLLLTFGGDLLEQPLAPVGTASPVDLTISDVAKAREERRGVVRELPAWLPLAESFRAPSVRQVRIEQRVIIRIVPQSSQPRANALMPAHSAVPMRIVERPVEGCIPLRTIAGASVDRANRLRLYTRNRQVLSVRFSKECRADAFYSGFYVEKSEDGMLCSARDVIHSRSGVRCSIGQISQLVAEPVE